MTVHRIVRLRETVSTNSDAMRLARAGEPLPLWVVAETQSAGRGRSGRQWISAAGNLHASIAFRSTAPLNEAGALSLVAGLALHDAVHSLSRPAPIPGLRLKWPNDLLIGTAKAGGILVESTTDPGGAGFIAVAGFGLNVAAAPAGLGRSVTSLADHVAGATAEAALQALVPAFDRWLAAWNNGAGQGVVLKAWIDRSGPLGEFLSINTLEGAVYGAYAGLTDKGGLRIDCGGTIREFTYGDVALVTDAGKNGPA